MFKFIATSPIQTKKIASALAREILKTPLQKSACIIALEGNLGSGKTTFAQGFAKGLGIRETPKSPTFVLMNVYSLEKIQISKSKFQIKSKIPKHKNKNAWKHLIHIDCYRIQSPKELLHLGIKEIFKDPHSIVLIEWAERIKKILPQSAWQIQFIHGKRMNERLLRIKSKFQNPNVK